MVACRPWLDAEIAAVGPELVVCLGAIAAKSLLGNDFRVTKERGKVLALPEQERVRVVATVHPSSVLRASDREAAYQALLADLTAAATALS